MSREQGKHKYWQNMSMSKVYRATVRRLLAYISIKSEEQLAWWFGTLDMELKTRYEKLITGFLFFLPLDGASLAKCVFQKVKLIPSCWKHWSMKSTILSQSLNIKLQPISFNLETLETGTSLALLKGKENCLQSPLKPTNMLCFICIICTKTDM